MNKKERMVVGKEAYISPEAEVLTFVSPLSFLDNGFSADLEAEVDIDDLIDAGEL